MRKILGFRCSLCGSEYDYRPGGDAIYTCARDEGNLDVVLDYRQILKEGRPSFTDEPSLWRYLPLLPVADPGGRDTPFRSVGCTPIFTPPYLKKSLGMRHLWVKDESFNPTASFKDRASAVVVARAREIEARVVVTASTGNAGAALAGMAASVGEEAVIFAPRRAPPAKIAQLLIFGARVLLVEGNYDEATDLSLQAAREFGWYCRNTGYNPFTAEGKKTAAFEIWEAVCRGALKNDSSSPLCLFIPVGDGNIISGVHKGFKDLQALDLLEAMPRLFGVQAEGSAAIANAYFAGTEEIKPVAADTLADSISVNKPADGVRALRAAAQTGGAYLTVADEEILSAIAALGRAGIFAEPAGAAAYAGLVKALKEGLIVQDDPVLVLNTGSGLKDTGAARLAVTEAPVIEPTLSAVKRILGRRQRLTDG